MLTTKAGRDENRLGFGAKVLHRQASGMRYTNRLTQRVCLVSKKKKIKFMKFLGILENIQSDLWKTIKDLGEPSVENCSNSRLIYHFESSYFETIESHLNMRQDRISECNIRYVTYHMSYVTCHMLLLHVT